MQIKTGSDDVRIALHNAVDKLLKSVESKGHNVRLVSNVQLTRRNNQQSGEHVHASCSIKLRFDESVSVEPVDKPIYPPHTVDDKF